MMVFALLVIPLILAVFIPPLGGPLVQAVLWLFFVAPFKLVFWLVRSTTEGQEEQQFVEPSLRQTDIEVDVRTPGLPPPPDWYNDPTRQGQLRWWDGRQWAEHTR
jgi:hypothetical protein